MSAFSAALDITAGGFTVLSFLDEVYMIYKVIFFLSLDKSNDVYFLLPDGYVKLYLLFSHMVFMNKSIVAKY
jgi:hypothetical protein